MPTRVHQNIGSFWNAAEMKLHVNRTCFYTGLKSQTGMSSFRLSCEHTLSAYQCIWDNKKMHKTITIPLLCHYELFIHTCVSKNAIAPKDAIFYLIDIAWYTIRFIVILFYIERKWILMRNLATQIVWKISVLQCYFFFSMWDFFHKHSRITRLQGKGEGISVTPHYHFHPLPPAIGRTRTGNLWFPSASRKPLSCAPLMELLLMEVKYIWVSKNFS